MGGGQVKWFFNSAPIDLGLGDGLQLLLDGNWVSCVEILGYGSNYIIGGWPEESAPFLSVAWRTTEAGAMNIFDPDLGWVSGQTGFVA